MRNIITNYEDFINRYPSSGLWLIVEYNPSYLGYISDKEQAYCANENRYSLMRNEILGHPQDYISRLNNGTYRIWTDMPEEYPW